MHKEFVTYDTIRNNAMKLAYRIYKDGFIPDVIYVSSGAEPTWAT